jgi:cytochrome P450
MFYAVSQHPDVRSKLEEEIDQEIPLAADAPPTSEILAKLEYTNLVIQESLRLYPPFWAMTRQSVADDVIGGHRIRAKSLIVISPYVTQRHPALWDDPERFDPLRFTSARSAGHPRLAYFPFGAGPRICIGMRNAMLAMQATLAMVSRRYRLNLVPGHRVEVHTAMTMRPKFGMRMNLSVREPKESK